MNIIQIISFISIFLILIGFLSFLFTMFSNQLNHGIAIKRRSKAKKFGILIPARDESKVIRGLLESIKNQSYKVEMNDVYIIIEEETDKTVLIANEYGANIIMRKDLTLKRKGYALNDALEELKSSNKCYDAYFIFDADNILDKNFIKEMAKSYEEGYAIGVSYRNCKNGNDSVVAASASLTFSLINTIMNAIKKENKANILISGTGYFIERSLIEKWQGFPFHSLTEDYQLTLYTILHQIPTTYNDKAIFYDEQPKKYGLSVLQRTRWIRGFFDVRKEVIPNIRHSLYLKAQNKGSKINEIMGIIPYVFIVVGVLLYILINIVGAIFINLSFLYRSLWMLGSIYFLLVVLTICIFIIDTRLNMSLKTKIKATFYHPLFLASYIICALKAIFQKNKIGWSRIEHDVSTLK